MYIRNIRLCLNISLQVCYFSIQFFKDSRKQYYRMLLTKSLISKHWLKNHLNITNINDKQTK